MKLSIDWLRDFVDLCETDPQAIADRLTEGIAEVESVEVQGEQLECVVVGKVVTLAKHPNADKLSLCDVETDRGIKRVVCGGTNLREGMRVAFAHCGARVQWHGGDTVTLEKAAIRGEESEGMICTAEELSLAERFPESRDRLLIDLGDGDAAVGTALREFLGLTDTVFHVDNHAITHRADLFSHVGFARECVALGLATWRRDRKPPHMPLFAKEPIPFSFVNDIPTLVSRYCSCIVEIEGPGETPDWMKRRLEATGWRTVSLPVDVTNYVMMETGMPLHAFDVADLKGDVRVRLSKRGEKIRTLDDVERELPEGAIVLSDKLGVFDLLGIMGGLRSSTKDATRRLYLHAAAVDPASIRRTIIATGHRTDAGTVYEKGVPACAVQPGFFRALELLQKLAPGARIASRMETWGDDGAPALIALSLARANSLLGTQLSAEDATRILAGLECKVKTEKKGALLQVTTPLHRLGDLRGEHDLIEELGRVVGYDAIEPAMPAAEIAPPPRDARADRLRAALAAERFVELVPLSMTSAVALERCAADPSSAVRIANPIGEELGLMQVSAIPALLEHAQRNLLNASAQLRTFHAANVFRREGEGIDERREMSLLLANMEDGGGPLEDPFLQLKQSLALALRSAGYAMEVDPASRPIAAAHPGRCADIVVGGRTVGALFEVHPAIRESFDLRHRAAAATLDMTSLLAIAPAGTVSRPVPQFPAVTYDETVTLPSDRTLRDVLRSVRSETPLLESVSVADLYGGERGRPMQVTLRFVYRAPDRTLTEEEAKREQEKALRLLLLAAV